MGGGWWVECEGDKKVVGGGGGFPSQAHNHYYLTCYLKLYLPSILTLSSSLIKTSYIFKSKLLHKEAR